MDAMKGLSYSWTVLLNDPLNAVGHSKIYPPVALMHDRVLIQQDETRTIERVRGLLRAMSSLSAERMHTKRGVSP